MRRRRFAVDIPRGGLHHALMSCTFDTAHYLSLVRSNGARYGQPVTAVTETSSTNDDALAAARTGAPDGSTFVADVQHRGRGRRGRSWYSTHAGSLTFSVLLRPQVSAERLPLMTLVTGLALREALLDVAPGLDGTAIGLKWPNDLLHEEHKLAGVLVESVFEQQRLAAVVIGIGVNVAEESFPDEIAHRATSLRLMGAEDVRREALLAATLQRLGVWMQLLLAGDLPAITRALRDHDAITGKRITVDGTPGIARGIDDAGALLVETDGRVRAVTAGTVELTSWLRPGCDSG